MNYDIDNFEAEVIQSSYNLPVLCDFWAEWCQPCKILGPILERLAEENNNAWKLTKLDTEAHPDVAAAFAIRSIPDVKLFYEGNVIAEFMGALPEHAIKEWLRQHLPSKNQKNINIAKLLMTDGKTEEAQSLFEEILSDEPENVEARVHLAKLIIFSDQKKSAELLKNIEEPKFSEIIEPVNTFIHLFDTDTLTAALPDASVKEQYLEAVSFLTNRQFDEALERFIEVIRSDRYYDNDGSRKACIAIFKYIGEEHPITIKYRRSFSSALY